MNTDSIRQYIEQHLSEKRKRHTEGVRETAVRLARRYGADPEKAETAALFHDMYRGVPTQVLDYYVRHLGLDPRYLQNPNLAHGKIAACIMARDYGIDDPDLCNAVSYHTTGRAGMSQLEKVVYLADAIEPGRQYPGVEALRELAWQDLDAACLRSLAHTVDYVRGQGQYLDPDTLAALADLREKQRQEKEDG